MKLSPPQVSRFWREWSAACRAQEWTGHLSAAEIDAKRKELLARAGFGSLTLVDKTRGFDRVLLELAALQDSITKQVQAMESPRRVLLHTIAELVNEYSLAGAISICKERHGTSDIESLSDDDLEKFRFTLTARVHAQRKKSDGAAVKEAEFFAEEYHAEAAPF